MFGPYSLMEGTSTLLVVPSPRGFLHVFPLVSNNLVITKSINSIPAKGIDGIKIKHIAVTYVHLISSIQLCSFSLLSADLRGR